MRRRSIEKEPPLLQEAFANMPRILVDACDVLVVDRIGKNFSGDGMDLTLLEPSVPHMQQAGSNPSGYAFWI